MRDTTIETGEFADLDFERQSPLRRVLKRFLLNPLANYAPASLCRALLKFGKSELAMANWKDPGGWRSMVISYNGRCRQIADRILVSAGTMPMALRNRRRLAARVIARLIERAPAQPVHVLCLGAGPGMIILDALSQTQRPARATLVDLSADAFDFGLQHARQRGLGERVRYIQADVRELDKYLDQPPHIVKLVGICEYLDDQTILDIARATAALMPDDAAVVFNSISRAHGADRFFRRVFGLHLNYRSPEQLQRLLARAGFGNFLAYAEPLGVYHIVTGRKLPAASVP